MNFEVDTCEAHHDVPDYLGDLRDDGVTERADSVSASEESPTGTAVQHGGNPINASTKSGLSTAPARERLPPERVSRPRWECMASLSVEPGLPVTMYPARRDAFASEAHAVGQSCAHCARLGAPFVAYSSRESPGLPLFELP